MLYYCPIIYQLVYLIMPNSLSKAERTRKFIIEATAGLFNTKGYAGTSMADLTEATGLTKGSIYGNFTGKEDVALAVFDHNLNMITSAIRDQISQAGNYHDKLMVYARVYRDYTSADFPAGGCPILNTSVEADDTNGLLKDSVTKALQRWKRGIINLVQGGIRAGEFKRNIDAEQVALFMIALLEGGIMIAKITDSPAVMDNVFNAISSLVREMKP